MGYDKETRQRLFVICQDARGKAGTNRGAACWSPGTLVNRTHNEWLAAGGEDLGIQPGDALVDWDIFEQRADKKLPSTGSTLAESSKARRAKKAGRGGKKKRWLR